MFLSSPPYQSGESVAALRLGIQNVVPALTINWPLDERSRFRGVGRAQIREVPFDLLGRPMGDVAEVVGFGCPARVLEVRAGHGSLALGVVDPLHPVARRAGQRFGRCLEVLESFLWQQPAIAQQHAVLAYEKAG